MRLSDVLRRLRLFDYVSLVAALAVIGAFSLAAYSSGTEQKMVTITSDDGEFIYPLDIDRELTLQGPLGTTEVEIVDGRVRVVSDPGRQQICVRESWIERSGQWLACLPSRIFILITGADNGDIDAQTF